MSHDNRNVSSIGKTLNSLTNKKFCPIKSHLYSSTKMPKKNKVLSKKGKWINNSTTRYQRGINIPLQNEIMKVKKIECKDYMESIDKSYDDMNDDNPVIMLRKEIQDWRINEILTSRTEERLTGTSSEQHSCSYVASGETTKRQQSPNNISKISTMCVDFPAVTKKRDVLEYLDLCTDPPVRLPASCRSKMHSHSHSACDCYCKTRVPIERQREEIQSGRSCIRCSIPKTKTTRSGNKIPLLSSRIIDDEPLDTKRSATTLPVSPILSPETLATLESVEKLIKDAEIQMKEISMTTSSGRLQKCTTIYTDETPLDDENDQLLYIRERVAFKFQEANGWIDTESQQSSREELVAKTKRIVDLSAPKFKTSDDRYKEFSQQRRLDIQKFGLSPFMDNTRENNEKKKDENRTRSSKHEIKNDRKISTFIVQAGPSVNIKGELITQNLENIHISPDSSFVQENPNVGTYMICHDFCKRNGFSPRKKEKVVRISDDNSGKSSMKSTNGKKGSDEIGNGTEISEKLERTDIVSKECSSVFVENDEKLIENKTEESLMKNLEKKENLESTMNFKLTQSINEKSIQKISNLKSENETVEEEADNSKISVKNDQKQIRFDEQISKPRNREKEKEICSNLKQDSTRILEDNNEKLKYSLSLADSKVNDELPLPSNIIEEIYNINKKRHKEICEKRKTEKEEERYKEIDKRFSNIVKKYCDKDEKLEKSQIDKENSSHILSLSIISSEDSEGSDEFYTLYEPAVEELDGVLSSYNKIIDNIVQSTKTIDKFLSRPEFEEYQVDDTTRIKTSKKLIDPVSLSKEKIYKKRKCPTQSRTKQSTVSKIKSSTVKDRLPAANKNISKEWDVNKMKRVKSTIFTKKDYDSKKKYAAPKISSKFPTRLNSLMKDRLNVWKKFPQEETSESNEDISKDGKTIGINASKQIPRHKTRLFRIVNDSSNLTTSSNYPQSSSIDAKNGNDTKIMEEISKSLIDDEIREKITILKINSLKVNKDDEVQKGNFGTLQNIVCSDILKQVEPEARCSKNLIARVFREETRLTEGKIKNIFNVNEIIPLILKNLKSDETNFENLKLLIVEDSNNIGSNEIQIIEERESNDEKMRSEKQDLQLEHLPNERNFTAGETIKCYGEIMRENILNKSDEKNSILIESIPNSEDELKRNQSISQSKNENIQDEEVDKINFNIDLKKNAEIDNVNNISKKNNENIISKDIDIQKKEINSENLISTETVSNIINESNGNKKYNAMYVNEKINLRNEDTNLNDINKISLITNDENMKHNDFEISDKCLDLKKEKSVELHSIKDTEKNDKQFDNNFSQVSSSNSLHNCISLRSSSKNLSKTSSNNPEFSQNMNEFRHIAESSVDDKIKNNFSYNLLEKKRILSNVYDDLDKKFSSTYIDTNYSSLLNQEYRLSNGISSISTIDSNKIEILSDISRSEGELYMPSSSSYSLGEVRMLTKNRSDGENAVDFDKNDPIYITKEMLTSWNESSKSLTQSIGEI